MFNTLTRMGASGASDYEIERSLRFNSGDSPELTRTPSGAGSRTTWTLSFWIKIASDDLGSHGFLFSTGANAQNKVQVNLESDNRLTFEAKSGSSTQAHIRPENNLRDISAWYHFVIRVDTTDGTSTNRVKIYMNGEQLTDFNSDTFPSQNTEFEWNKAQEHNIGKRTYSASYFNGYMAEIHHIDGTALTPSSFGETDTETGQWVAKKYSGSYGTNGFYLNFSDNSGTTATTLGKDSSGNGNNFTPNNFSITSGETSDSLTDTPSENFCVINSIEPTTTKNGTVTNGNLDVAGDDYILQKANWHFGPGGITSGKWMWEIKNTSSSGNTQYGAYAGITANFTEDGGEIASVADKSWASTSSFAYKDYNQTSSTAPGAGNQALGTMTFGLDLDAQTLKYYYNGSLLNTDSSIPDPAVTEIAPFIHSTNSGGADWANSHFNFGQRGFSYGELSGLESAGYKALSTANISDPTIDIPKEHFDTLLYTGTGSSHNITGLEYQPDLVWIKKRNSTESHEVQDAVRGATKRLSADTNAAESTVAGSISSFNSDGFTVVDAGMTNESGHTYVAWNWKGGGSASSNSNGSITSSVSANTTAGFSIITYTGTGSQTTVGHGLGVAPKVVITKLRDTTTQDWFFMTGEIMSDRGKYIKFNDDGGIATDAHTNPNVAPTSTVYTIGGDDGGNGSNAVSYTHLTLPTNREV